MCPKAVGCVGEKDGFLQLRQSGGGTRWRDGGAEEERAGPTSGGVPTGFHTRRWNPASATVEAQLLS